MNDPFVYHPYKTQTWPLVFTIPVGILAFVGAGYCLPHLGIGAISFAGIGIICVWLTKVLYDASNRLIIFEQKGLRIVGGRYCDYRYKSWEELAYACYIRNYKGHLFLVLSPNVLSPKEAKVFANLGANSSRICINDAVVIYVDILQNVSQIKQLIDNHVLHIDSH